MIFKGGRGLALFSFQISIVFRWPAHSQRSVDVDVGFAEQSGRRDSRNRVLWNSDFIRGSKLHFHLGRTVPHLRIGPNSADGTHVHSGDPNRGSCLEALDIVETRLKFKVRVALSADEQNANCGQPNRNNQRE